MTFGRTLRIGAGSGAFGASVVAVRDVLLSGGGLSADPLWFAQHGAVQLLFYALIGALLGLAISLAAQAVIRVLGKGYVGNRVSGGFLLILSGIVMLIATPSALVLTLLAAVLLAVGGTSLVIVIGDEERSDWLSLGAGIIIGGAAFFGGGRAALASIFPATALGYTGITVGACIFGWFAYRGTAGLRLVLERRWSPRVVVAALSAALLAPAGLLALTALLPTGAIPASVAGRTSPRSSDASRPSVILISVDTLRADFVGYAGGPARTPNIDALAAESYVFENAYSVAPWTRPSFASFFSSRYPSEMGVARVRGAGGEGRPAIPTQWSEEPLTLAEAMAAAGYATAACVTNMNLTSEANADQGFHFFIHCSASERSADAVASPMGALSASLFPCLSEQFGWRDLERASVVTSQTQDLLQRIPERPMMLWVHYQDPHDPYDAPEAPDDESWGIGEFDTYAILGGRALRSTDERAAWVRAYTREIEYFDGWLGELIATLKREGLWDSSLVVFWSDHGEEFWEHDLWQHGQSLYNELLHVPLLIRRPHTEQQSVVPEPVSLMDVMPTVLSECGIAPPPDIRGRLLGPIIGQRHVQMPAFRVFIEACGYGSIQKALMTERHKLIYNLYSDDFTLYDLQEDPGEQHNIYGTPLAPDTAEMERELLDWTEKSLAMMDEYVAKQGAEDVPPEVLERLRDMGYVQ